MFFFSLFSLVEEDVMVLKHVLFVQRPTEQGVTTVHVMNFAIPKKNLTIVSKQ